MKVILTKTELETVMTRIMGIPVEEVIIEDAEKPTKNLVEILTNAVEKFRFTSDQKILAIKSLREAAQSTGRFLGLADAKYAVDNWGEFIAFVRKYETIPSDDFSQRKHFSRYWS